MSSKAVIQIIESLNLINNRISSLEKLYYGETNNNSIFKSITVDSNATNWQLEFLSHKVLNIAVYCNSKNNSSKSIVKWDITQESLIDFLSNNTNWNPKKQSFNDYIAATNKNGTLGEVWFVQEELTETEKSVILSWLNNIFNDI